MEFSTVLFSQTLPSIISFLAKGLIVLGLIALIVGIIASAAQAKALRPRPLGRLEVRSLNDDQLERRRGLEGLFLSRKQWKERQKQDEQREKKRSEQGVQAQRLWVIDFKGDLTASRVDGLRHEITALIDLRNSDKLASDKDEVLVRIESPGGTVTGYGLAAAQIARLRDSGFKVTASIDEIAASGGYLMASVAHTIIAAPFALVGSIGVVASLPNFHRLLKDWNVDFIEVTAGEHKRPVSLFGEMNEQGLKKLRDQIQLTHSQFQSHVQKYRPQLDLTAVATGDVWHAEEGLKLGLVDQIMTSDGFIDDAIRGRQMDAIAVTWRGTKGLRARIEEETFQSLFSWIGSSLWSKLQLLLIKGPVYKSS